MSRQHAQPLTLFEKIWRRHEVVAESVDAPAILYVDLHLTHEVTSPQAFAQLRGRGLPVRRPELTIATMDHIVPTRADQLRALERDRDLDADSQIQTLRRNCRDFAVELLDLHNERRGIVHVVGPELGLTQPGKLIVCGDSHTSSHGALGALAFGIGTTEVEHVLATQCLLQRKPRTLAVNVNGTLRAGVTAKDLILAIIGRLGVGGGAGHVIEYRGETVRALEMEARITLCNMSIEAGARAGMVAPDAVTFAYLKNRARSPRGGDWERALDYWRGLPSDTGACFDRELNFDADALAPMISYGTNPGMVIPVSGCIPDRSNDTLFDQALAYMGFSPGLAIRDLPIQVVFIGSCTNGRLSDLRAAAALLRGRKVARSVRMLVVPGSGEVKRQAEAEGLDRVFVDAGAQWREPGCSMCIGMNGDAVARGEYCVSTSNRNFEGRQGSGARTLLASPLTAAASAVRGRVTDPRELL